MRSQVAAALAVLGIGLVACGSEDESSGSDELTSTEAVAEQIPGCEDSFEDVSDNNGYPEIVDSRASCTYRSEKLFIELFADAAEIEPFVSSLPDVAGVAYVTADRWVVQVPAELADGLVEDLGVDVDRIE